MLFKIAQFKLFKVEKGIVFWDVCFNGTLLVLMNMNISKIILKNELRINQDFKIFDICEIDKKREKLSFIFDLFIKRALSMITYDINV